MEKLGISASPEELVDFFYKLNSNAEFRAEFLENPLKVLVEARIVVEEESHEEIERIVNHLKNKYKDDLWNIPVQQMKYEWDLNRDGVIVLTASPGRTGVP